LFLNNLCTKEINELDLGIVPAGSSKLFKFYVKNESKASLIELKFEVNNKEVKLIKYPTALKENEVDELLVEWNPEVTLKEGLKTNLEVTGKELWS
jgi:hypothetical protein